MPEEINGRKIFSLFEVTRSIQKTIAARYRSSYWIKAEMNKLNFYQHSGHCYPDLIEKQEGRVIAQIRCNLWKDDYLQINSAFQRVLNEPLKDGIKILFLATISYHPEYGLALRIIDIDPSFTLGDLEREKQETVKKLQEEGIFKKNKMLKIPMLPQRIAIISVQTSKGYGDFLKMIDLNYYNEIAKINRWPIENYLPNKIDNVWGYKFFHYLFPSLLQGDNAIQSIINQLKRIKKVIHHFDVVAIVRGGGGDVGLSCYNNYELAKEIALFPIPIITGIGHATNQTVVEMIAFENAITPTKLAEFLIQKFHNFSVPVQKAEEKIIDKSRRLIADEKSKFQSETKLFRSVTSNILLRNKNVLKENVQSLFQQSHFIFKNEKEYLESIRQGIIRMTATFCNISKQILLQFGQSIKKDTISQLKQLSLLITQSVQQIFNGSKNIFKSQNIELLNIEKNVSNMSPQNVLKRGYSITLLNGKAVTAFNKAKQGDILNTILHQGTISSTVNSTSKPTEQ